MKWSKHLPTKYGDYLWVVMWDCNCCVQNCGIAFVLNPKDYRPDENGHLYIYSDEFAISWEGKKPFFLEDGTPYITHWTPCLLPGEDDDGQSEQPLNNEQSCTCSEAT